MRFFLTALLLLLSTQGYSSAAFKPFSNIVKIVGNQAAETLVEETFKDVYKNMKEGKPAEACKPSAAAARRTFAREYTVSCNGTTTCNTAPNTIVRIGAISGKWRCCGQHPEATYTGYSSKHHNCKNADHNFMCLLSDAYSSQGTPVAVGDAIPNKKKQLIFWANDMENSLGSLKVTLICEET